MKKNRIISASALLLAALIWGIAFVAQDALSDRLEPFTVNALRSFIASAVLIPVAMILRRSRGKRFREENKNDRKTLLTAGVICGAALCLSVNLQQFAISSYPEGVAVSGRAGFITALYIIFVPILGLFLRKKPGITIILAVLLATVGLYFLCLKEGISSVYPGDLIMMLCSVSFSIQILCVDHFIDRVDPVKLSSLQFFITGVISMILMLVFEHPTTENILSSWMPILYLAVLSSGAGYTLQILGQKYSDSPTVSSVLMSMESVFAALGGAIFAAERLSGREILGCVIMFTAIIIAQLPTKAKRKQP